MELLLILFTAILDGHKGQKPVLTLVMETISLPFQRLALEILCIWRIMEILVRDL